MLRSVERRVGKECRSRGSPDHYKDYILKPFNEERIIKTMQRIKYRLCQADSLEEDLIMFKVEERGSMLQFRIVLMGLIIISSSLGVHLVKHQEHACLEHFGEK